MGDKQQNDIIKHHKYIYIGVIFAIFLLNNIIYSCIKLII